MKGKQRLSIGVFKTTCGSQEARLFENDHVKGQPLTFSWIASTVFVKPFSAGDLGRGSFEAANREAAIAQFRAKLLADVIIGTAKTVGDEVIPPRLLQLVPRVTDRKDPFAPLLGHAVLERSIPVTASSLRALEPVA
ncbi:hypothetical protein [Paraburkholderia youngii]|uniref:hypothetical protein n=1 Tax=Paraburkholderia youngii TaxID=2782701 RepID=UPI003D1D9C29